MTPTPILIYGKQELFNSSAAIKRAPHILCLARQVSSDLRGAGAGFFSLIASHQSLVTRFLIYGSAIRNPRKALKT